VKNELAHEDRPVSLYGNLGFHPKFGLLSSSVNTNILAHSLASSV